MFRKNTPIETSKDRWVTPTVDVRGMSTVILDIPVLNDDSLVYVEKAIKRHEWNYPYYKPDNIIAEWRFDDADGTTIVDSVAGITLTEQGDPTYATTAATIGLGNTVVYDGTGDAHDVLTSDSNVVNSGILVGTGDFSVEVIGFFTNASVGAGDTIIACRDGASGVGWQMEFDANQYVDFHVDDGTETVLTGATDAATGSFVHIVASLDRSANGVIYINSAADDTTAITTSPGTLTPTAGASARLCIGGDAARTAGDCLYGSLAFIRVYNKALTAAEVLANYRCAMAQGTLDGWSPLADPQDGDDLAVSKSASDPNTFDLSLFLPPKHNYFLRAVCAVEQTTSATELPFSWQYK